MIVNGKQIECKENESIMDLAKELNLNVDRIVVEIDGVIIHKEDFQTHKLEESNIVEVVSFVGGG
ncbi:sulfur carrier protein ThiS [Inconstantimicrobium mannanitabidum]|uniref:Thiamine biosynthesis protein ThiS n=1 Tax=Inconstantimicrobium mannanitabidum TaxID=1604901 RepID=A0ACB5RI48_9CLOT|nr:sulfur carrier protein ThiS [Clostridium sp. TW13]GKX68774.1 thiamine biosynthesis protein ThiS [Clostridium sp. TW13]